VELTLLVEALLLWLHVWPVSQDEVEVLVGRVEVEFTLDVDQLVVTGCDDVDQLIVIGCEEVVLTLDELELDDLLHVLVVIG